MTQRLKNDFTYVILGIIFIGLTIGSLSSLLSAKRLASEHSDAVDLHNSYIASRAGIEIAKNHIELNRLTEAGKLPLTFHLNGALFEVEWNSLNTQDSTMKIISSGFSMIDDIMVKKSIFDTTIIINYNRFPHLNPGYYFGN